MTRYRATVEFDSNSRDLGDIHKYLLQDINFENLNISKVEKVHLSTEEVITEIRKLVATRSDISPNDLLFILGKMTNEN
jgi:uncharacterized protein YfkK (UPF0435 family)